MGTLPHALEIILEVQKKKISEKLARRKISFPIYKTQFYFIFLFFWLPLSNLITSLFILNNLKCYMSTTWSSTNCL